MNVDLSDVLGERTNVFLASLAAFNNGLSSINVSAVESVPPDTPPLSAYDVVDLSMSTLLELSGDTCDVARASKRVLADRNALKSAGRESKPHEGMIMALDFVAR